MYATWSHSDYEAVARIFTERTGMVIPPPRIGEAERATRTAMKHAGARSVEEFLAGLSSKSCWMDKLIDLLAVGESYFFREPEQFRAIRHTVVPELVRTRPADHVIQVWSTSCASGQEAYSLAILFEELGLADRVRIVGTDISPSAIENARRGSYRDWSLRLGDEALLGTYFDHVEDNHVLKQRLRNSVEFRSLNLMDDCYPDSHSGIDRMDLILCRNVLIYFDKETVRSVAKRLFMSLAEGGWLVTASTDPSLADHAEFDLEMTDYGMFYRRSACLAPAGEDPEEQRRAAGRQPCSPTPAEATREPDIVSEPKDHLKEAERAFGQGQYARALLLTSGSQTDVEAWLLHIRAIMNLGRAEDAESAVNQALAQHPVSFELHNLRAIVLINTGKLRGAVEALRRVIYLDSSLAMAHFTLGSVLQRLGDHDRARQAIERTRDLCAARQGHEPVPLSDGECAGWLAELAAAQLELLDRLNVRSRRQGVS